MKSSHLTVVAAGLLFFMGGAQAAHADDNTPKQIRYWFDGDLSHQLLNYGTNQSIDVSHLIDGVHQLRFQVTDGRGQLSPVSTSLFLKSTGHLGGDRPESTPKTIQYWFDGELNHQTLTYSTIQAIDVSHLEDGVHQLRYQITDSRGEVSPVCTSLFLKSTGHLGGDRPESTPKTIQYWFDGSLSHQTLEYGAVQSLDVSHLEDGVHQLRYQITDSRGEVSPVCTSLFLKATADTESGTPSQIRYWFDDKKTDLKKSFGTGAYTLDISELEDGVHFIHVQVIDSKGKYSPAVPHLFIKAPEQIVDTPKYIHYWIAGRNDKQTLPYQTQLVKQHDFLDLPEGDYALCYQVETERGTLSPVAGMPFFRAHFDLYVRTRQQYNQAIADSVTEQLGRPFLKLYYSMSNYYETGQLEVDQDVTLSLGKYRQDLHLGRYNETNSNRNGISYGHSTTLMNHGFMRADSVQVAISAYKDRWHFLSLPFNAKLSEALIPEGNYWALRYYNGAARAAGNMDYVWSDLNAQSTIQAGRGYIFQFTKGNNYNGDDRYVSEFLFRAINDGQKNNIFATTDVTVPLEEHVSEFAHNRSWNLVGNPYPTFFDTRLLSLSNPITVWTGSTYKAISPEDDAYVLAPFEAFFIQRPVETEGLTFQKEGRQDSPVANESPAAAPRRVVSRSDRQVYNLALSDTTLCDECRIVINEDAQTTYEAIRDAAKFMSTDETVAQLCSERDGIQYAINERPLADGLVALSLRIPQTADYTLSLASVRNAQLPVYLYDKETQAVTRLDETSYTFAANEGLSSSRLVLSFGEVTGLDDVQEQLHGKIEVYDISGKRCYRGRKALAEVGLPAGVYVVRSKDAVHKVFIK